MESNDVAQPSDGFHNLKARMWTTGRCHMRAEKRNRFLEHYFHIVLALYALSAIGTSLYPIADTGNSIQKFIIPFASVFTLSISLLIFGFKFGESAAKHRSCYLELQKLDVSRITDAAELNEKYITVLGHYSNHSYSDFMKVALHESNGIAAVARRFSFWERKRFRIFMTIAWVLALAFAAGPFLIFFVSIGVIR